jgi:hypothetical protein
MRLLQQDAPLYIVSISVTESAGGGGLNGKLCCSVECSVSQTFPNTKSLPSSLVSIFFVNVQFFYDYPRSLQ